MIGTRIYLCFFILFFFSFHINSAVSEVTLPIEPHGLALEFNDDKNFDGLLTAIDRQLEAFDKMNLPKALQVDGREITKETLKNSLNHFKTLLLSYHKCSSVGLKSVCHEKLTLALNQDFMIFRPYQGEKTAFTAYYSPDFDGSFTKTDTYQNTIYSKPRLSELRSLTREQIDFDKLLEGRGSDLVFVKQDLYDLYLLHIEGGGRVKVVNDKGEIENFYLSYDGTNKKRFQFISRYMKKQGYLSNNLSTYAQRKFLQEHPEKMREIFSQCPSYIYFKLSKKEPLGIDNISLTPERSLALDRDRYPFSGLLTFVQAKRPVMNAEGKIRLQKFARFYLHQDTGGAIRGNARADLYFGFGHEAELAANHLSNKGNMFFLIKRD